MYGKKEFHTNHKSFQGHQKRIEGKGKENKTKLLKTTIYIYIGYYYKAQGIEVGNGKSWGSCLGLWLKTS